MIFVRILTIFMKGKLKEMSTEDLLKQEKLTKTVTGALGGMLLVLFVMGVFLLFKKFYAILPIPVALLPVLIVNLNSLKEIREELNSRKDPQ